MQHKRNSNKECFDSHNCTTCMHAEGDLRDDPCLTCVELQCKYEFGET